MAPTLGTLETEPVVSETRVVTVTTADVTSFPVRPSCSPTLARGIADIPDIPFPLAGAL